MLMKKNLIIDASNMLYRTFFANSKDKEAEDIIVGLCNQAALLHMRYYYNKFKPDNIIMVFDDYSWRKKYTSDLSTCITNKKYKGQRRKNLTKSQEEMLNAFDGHVNDFYELLKKRTEVIVFRKKYLEADDLIAGFTQMFEDDHNIIISADKDFIQLLSSPNVTLIDPIKDKERDLEEWDNDPSLFMFEKCIRGDTSDNVQSSYPRLLSKKIRQAHHDDYLFNNIMDHTFTIMELDENNKPCEVEYSTAELYEENQLLMDLTMQPDGIKKIIKKTIEKSLKNVGKFDYYKFMRFCAQHDMERICNDLDSLVPMLKNTKKG